jgi:hypothetical protein
MSAIRATTALPPGVKNQPKLARAPATGKFVDLPPGNLCILGNELFLARDKQRREADGEHQRDERQTRIPAPRLAPAAAAVVVVVA